MSKTRRAEKGDRIKTKRPEKKQKIHLEEFPTDDELVEDELEFWISRYDDEQMTKEELDEIG